MANILIVDEFICHFLSKSLLVCLILSVNTQSIDSGKLKCGGVWFSISGGSQLESGPQEKACEETSTASLNVCLGVSGHDMTVNKATHFTHKQS